MCQALRITPTRHHYRGRLPSTMGLRAYPDHSAAAAAAAHVCSHCSKSFSRLCDLNKHAKSHSRPFKCKEPGCKYNTLGWPTAKELERHHNDKHSATPRTFPCLFHPCSYFSKRESNCKQHMEKTHAWKYVRSKTKGKQPTAQDAAGDAGCSPDQRGTANETDLNTSAASSSPQSTVVESQGADFVLYDGDQADAIGGGDDSLYPFYPDAQSAQSYLPWTSPMTRLRKNESIIEYFSQAYHGAQEFPSIGANTPHGAPDLALSNSSFHGTQRYPQSNDRSQLVGDVAVKVESPVVAVDATFPRKRKYEPVDASTTEPRQPSRMASGARYLSGRKHGPGQDPPTPSKTHGVSKQGDNSDMDGGPPKKKSKQSPAEDFNDTSMPDIFRFAHPHIYDRSRTDRYSPCHTVHREISTLVRHLSRPAHRLKVTERFISSFDTDDSEFSHPRAGVCRTCWQTFDHRSAFEAHVSRACQKVSKGKREKWRVLYECFTPIFDATEATFPGVERSQQIEQSRERSLSQQSGLPVFEGSGHMDEAGTPPTSVPSPVIVHPTDQSVLQTTTGRFVSTGEHDRLQKEHQALRERNQQLERMAQVLLMQRLVQESMKNATAPTPGATPPATGSTKTKRRGALPAMSDQDSLVQHMDSQSTDVDVHAFMAEMENTRQNLSRMDSGLSTTSRSTIHHVPPSPPSRHAKLPGSQGSDPVKQQPKHSLALGPPCPSIPDSGYGTEQRRCSQGDLLPGAGQPTHPLSLPVAVEVSEETHTGPVWGDINPFQQQQQQQLNGTLSPRHSQPGFLTDQEMADYSDDSFNIFYQDNILHSRASPLGFTFDYPSQAD